MLASNPALTLALALAAGVVSQSLARHLRLPGIVVLLIAGVALGPDGIGWVEPRALGDGFHSIVDLAVAVILFEGGLNLEISRLRRAQVAIRRLVLLGAVATLAGASLVAWWELDAGWERAVLFGSLVVVTGPTVVGPLVSELRLRQRVATVLNAEGVLIDPVGAILAVLVLELVLAPEHAVSGATGLLLRVGTGAALGAVAGVALAQLLRIRRLVPEGHENILVLAAVLLVFEVADALSSHSGILAVTIAGVVVGNSKTLVDRDLREFKDQLTVLLIGLLFVLLAADVRFADVAALGWSGVRVVAALVLVVRPAVVALATAGSDLTWRERAFVAWVAPRGIVAAAVASLVAGAMEESGLGGGAQVRALVFLTIAGTVVQAGLTAGFVAQWLGVRLPRREGVAILGAQGLGLLLARELRATGVPVVFLDSNPQACRQAEDDGFAVVFGNALEERTLQRARLEAFESVVGLTPNQTVNAVFANRARDLFHVPRAYIAVHGQGTGFAAELVRDGHAKLVFEGPHDVERWDVRLRHGGVEVAHFEFEGAPAPADEGAADASGATSAKSAAKGAAKTGEAASPPPIAERCVMLAVHRGGAAAQPVSRGWAPAVGDRVGVALHVPDGDDAVAVLRARGWKRVEDAEDEPSSPAAGSDAAAVA